MSSRLNEPARLYLSAEAPHPPEVARRVRRQAGLAGVTRKDRLGAMFLLSLVWLLFEFGRPPTPGGLMLLITAGLFVDWLPKRDKQLGGYWIWWLVLLAVIASGVAFAPNTFSSYFNTRMMGILFLGFCLPLQGLLTSLRRVRWWVCAFIGVSFYVGVWAATHGGYGPAATNGQDENYVAALMTMGMALAYFSFFTARRLWSRLLLGAAMLSYVAAIALAQNPSRGGFLALVAVALYCLWRSPRKVIGLSILGAVALPMVAVAGDSFWKEVETSTDYKTGTGDLRLELWQAGLRMWKSNPVLGVGSGNFRWVLSGYQSPAQFEKFGRDLGGTIAHSSHVEMLSELGSFGSLAMIILTWSTWKALGKIRPSKPERGEPPVHADLVELGNYADAIRCAILAVLANGTFVSLFYYSHLWVLIAVGTALPYVHRRILQQEVANTTPAANVPAPAMVNTDTHASQPTLLGRVRGLQPRRRA